MHIANIDTNLFGRISEIWDAKNWDFPTTEEKAEAFNRLCEMLSHLTPPQQELVLTLTRYYSRYSFTAYQSLLIQAFARIADAEIEEVDQVILAPLINVGDDKARRSKSGHTLLYIAEHVAIPSHKKLQAIKVICLASPEAIPNHLSADKKTMLILLDDFVGSGDTAKAAVQYWQSKVGKEDEILVVALIAMNHAVDWLSTYKIRVICAELVYKGIAENSAITNKSMAYSLIDGAEASLKITTDQRRGYKNSEALISMIRTPDNTFPIYWCNEKEDGSSWPAPFPRN